MRGMADMATSQWPFMKMHGAGNDFVVIDGRDTPQVDLAESLVRALADRHRGVGFDQLGADH